MRSIRNRWLLIGWLLLLVACDGQSGSSKSVAPSQFGQAAPSSSTVEFKLQEIKEGRAAAYLGETILRIPSAYIPDKRNREGHVDPLGGVNVEVALPALEPWSKVAPELLAHAERSIQSAANVDEDQSRALMRKELAKSLVVLRLKYGHCFGLIEGMDAQLQKWGQRVDAGSRSPFDEYKLGRPAGSLRTMYVPRARTDYRTFIECQDTPNEVRRCKGFTDYDGLISMEYSFEASHLPRYADIEGRARKLVESFIVLNRPSADMPASCKARTRIVGS